MDEAGSVKQRQGASDGRLDRFDQGCVPLGGSEEEKVRRTMSSKPYTTLSISRLSTGTARAGHCRMPAEATLYMQPFSEL